MIDKIHKTRIGYLKSTYNEERRALEIKKKSDRDLASVAQWLAHHPMH